MAFKLVNWSAQSGRVHGSTEACDASPKDPQPDTGQGLVGNTDRVSFTQQSGG